MRRLLVGASALVLAVGLWSAEIAAETPKDQLVIGMNMANMLGLDPHEIGQFEPSHVFANVYDQLLATNPDDLSEVVPLAVESWQVDDDGNITMTLREGMTFQSGNPVTVDDVIWSLNRLMTLNKSGSSDFKDFGYTAENMPEKLKKIDDRTFVLEQATPVSADLKLYFLAKPYASVLDSKEIMAHEVDGDLGAGWLATHAAGSGPFALDRWAPNDIAILERYDDYWAGPAKMSRVLIRHIPESQTQRLLLEQGDLDVGYTLSSADFAGLDKNPDVDVQRIPGGGHYYFAVNMKDPDLGKREVREALKWCIDYEGINSAIMPNYGLPWQRLVLPGVLGALPDRGLTLDIERCKQELADAGYPDGMSKTLRVLTLPPFKEIAEAIQATMAQAGVEVEILPGDGGQVYGSMRKRDFEMLVGRSGGGFIPDPHDTLQGDAYNPDNSDEAQLTGQLAWRASWYFPEVNALIEQGLVENDRAKREKIYQDVQHLIDEISSFKFPISQRLDPLAVNKRVQNYRGDPTWMVRWEVVDKAD